MRAYHILPLLCLGLSPVWAATAPSLPAPPVDQRIERIDVQDTGAHIHELRVGGETQNITVQPRNGMPAYEIVPANAARNRRLDERDGGAGSVGGRVWKLLSF